MFCIVSVTHFPQFQMCFFFSSSLSMPLSSILSSTLFSFVTMKVALFVLVLLCVAGMLHAEASDQSGENRSDPTSEMSAHLMLMWCPLHDLISPFLFHVCVYVWLSVSQKMDRVWVEDMLSQPLPVTWAKSWTPWFRRILSTSCSTRRRKRACK